jgi:hypothetical protein
MARQPSRRQICLSRWMPCVLAAALFPTAVYGQLTGIALTFQSVANGVSISGAGTGSATLGYGTVSAFGTVPSGVSRTVASSAYTLSTAFGVRVSKSVLVFSSSYTLRSRLQAASAMTWTVDGVAMATSYSTIDANEPYASTRSHDLAFTVPFTQLAGATSTSFDVLAIAN